MRGGGEEGRREGGWREVRRKVRTKGRRKEGEGREG